MVVVAGRGARILPGILGALADAGVRAHGGVAHDPAQQADLFTLAVETDAAAVVGVEQLAWWGGTGGGVPDPDLLEHCLRAVRAPARPRLVWVTAQGPDDDGPRTIRRSGAPYVIVRVAPLVALAPPATPDLLEGREVLVPRDLPEPMLGVCTEEEVGRAVARAVVAPEVGRTIEVGHRGPDAWCEALSALGARARRVGSFRASAARLMGQPVAGLLDRRLSIRGLGTRPVRGPGDPTSSDETEPRPETG